MSNELFPWVKHLPEHERTRFWQELYTQLDATHGSLSSPTWVDYELETEHLIAAWRERAQMFTSTSREERQEQAAREAAGEMFAGLMPGNTGTNMADEVADKILAAIRKVV